MACCWTSLAWIPREKKRKRVKRLGWAGRGRLPASGQLAGGSGVGRQGRFVCFPSYYCSSRARKRRRELGARASRPLMAPVGLPAPPLGHVRQVAPSLDREFKAASPASQ